MRGLRTVAASLVVLTTSAAALCADLRVPEDFSDLKSALFAAQQGDRVLVRGGRWRNGRISRSGVALIGQGAVLSGDWEINGTRASVEGCTFRDAHVTVAADGVTLRGNRFIAPTYTQMVDSDGVKDFLFEDNRCTLAAVYAFTSTNAVARGNRLAGGEIALYGASPLIEDNVCTRSAQVSIFDGAGGIVRRNRTRSIYAWSVTSASIQDNTITGGLIDVIGDSALVEANRLSGSASLHVDGDSAVVRANTGTIGRFGLSVAGEAPVVMDNVVARRTAIANCDCPVIFVNGATPGSVVGNVVTHLVAEGIVVLGRGHEVADNVVRGRFCKDSIRVEGSSSSIRRNRVEQTGGRFGEGSGIVLFGDSTMVEDNFVAGAIYDGIKVTGANDVLTRNEVRSSGRCGITILNGSDLAFVTDCTVSGAGWSAVLNAGDRTTFAGGSFVGGVKVDVLDLGGATQFSNATFSTKSTDPALAPFR
jgi:Right handed beta helix region